MRKRTFMTAFAFAVLTMGCTTTSEVMESWVGSDESKLIEAWGVPDSTMTLADGKKAYTWKRVWSDKNGVHQGRQTFIVGIDGKVTKWSYENMPMIQLK